MPTFVRRAGFGTDGQKLVISGGTTVHSSTEATQWWAASSKARLQKGEAVRDSWLTVGVTEVEIEETINALQRWGTTDGAWYGMYYAALQSFFFAFLRPTTLDTHALWLVHTKTCS